eukprot:CAMPEP_0169175478 /NCGR_PEP_ID=MMETSP1015-20121227/65272_1 /TAXON_ID=342587 /ORGANISM="Karlodinium micrum, Strain CCMP2283" /LENGTH=48 /DNA_ID= /DNA_START= /DNA_END= /DNA_ORIENTATION=
MARAIVVARHIRIDKAGAIMATMVTIQTNTMDDHMEGVTTMTEAEATK